MIRDVMAPTRRGLIGVTAGGFIAQTAMGKAAAQDQTPLGDIVVSGPDTIDTIDLRNDPFGRITAQVVVNGQGPFRFFVDSGANRSALSAATAARVGAISAGEGLVHSIGGADIMPMVTLNSLRCGVFEQHGVTVPILSDDLIEPVDGMLGMERFSGLRLEFDNTAREMVVKRAGRAWPGSVSLPAIIKFGQLVSAKGRMGGLSVPIIFDTGAYYALCNIALRNKLQARASRLGPMKISTATAPIFVEDSVIIPEIKLENCVLTNTPAYVGDFHIFKLWDMIDQPALIVGMQVLKTVKRFAFDYRRSEVQFAVKG